VRGEIAFIEQRAVCARCVGDATRERTRVERRALGARDLLERARVVGEHDALGRARRAPVRREHALPLGERRKRGVRARPEVRSARRHEISVAREADRGFHQVCERQTPEALPHRGPARDGARHRDRLPASHRHAALPVERAARLPRGRTARRVEPDDLAVEDRKRERVAADPVRRRLEHRHRRCGRHRRIGRIAPAAHDLEPRLRCERLARRDRHRPAHGGPPRVVRQGPVDLASGVGRVLGCFVHVALLRGVATSRRTAYPPRLPSRAAATTRCGTTRLAPFRRV
jgi:hypothetical protein